MNDEPTYVEDGEQGEFDYAEERARDEANAEAEAQAKYESDMSAQAEQEAQQQAETEAEMLREANLEENYDFDMKLKAIAETLQGQIEELRERIEALERK